MPFTVQELENISDAALDLYIDQGKVHSQAIQDKPLLMAMRKAQTTFPSGKENISVRVKFDYTTDIMGYSDDDEVTYGNPANIKQAYYPWKEIHSGIKVTLTELKKDGISVVDSATGKSTTEHSGREKTALANLLDDKMEDMVEGTDQGMNRMYWEDGSQDAKEIPGIRSIILTDPTTATLVGGIDQSIVTKWRNRSNGDVAAALKSGTGIDVSAPSALNLVTALQREFRQLRKFASPKHLWLGGSDFLDAFERELRSKGNFTLDGWAKSGRIDASVSDVSFKGVPLDYDPTLDDMGLSKYAYLIDTKSIMPKVMEGEDMKKHFPARPENKYVIYRALTYTGGLIAKRRNTSGVYWIA